MGSVHKSSPWADPSGSPSSASATAPRPWSRGCSTTVTPTRGDRPRPDARAVRRVPRPRHRVRRRVRRGRQEGRPRPLRGHRRQGEQHHQDRRRAAAGRAGAARPHPGRPGQVLPRDHRRVRRGAGGRRRRAREPGPTCWSATCRSARSTRRSSTPSARSTPRSPSSTRCRSSSPAPRSGPRSSTAAGVPIVGDDIKSQVGATITHRVLAKLFEDRGVILDRTKQLNVGGNMDFKNMLERERLESKKISKTQSVTSQHGRPRPGRRRNVHIGPSDYVPWLDDRKWAYVRLEGRAFGDVPLNLEYKLEVWDSPNSAGIIIDAAARRQDRQGPRHRRPAAVGVLVLHEVPAGAVRRQRRPRRSWKPSSAARSSADQACTALAIVRPEHAIRPRIGASGRTTCGRRRMGPGVGERAAGHDVRGGVGGRRHQHHRARRLGDQLRRDQALGQRAQVPAAGRVQHQQLRADRGRQQHRGGRPAAQRVLHPQRRQVARAARSADR